MHTGKPVSLAELVTNRLRIEIVEGQFDFGDALSESRIARRYEVSRTPVREAFARLEQEGLVRTEPQSGTYVFTMDKAEFVQVSETRSILELGALRLAMQRNSAGLIEDWREITEKMSHAIDESDGKLYSSCDARFHEVLFIHAQNPYLDASRRAFSAKMDTIRNKLGATSEHMKKSFGEHVALYEHIAAGNVDGAAVILDQHIRHKGASFWTVPDSVPKTRWDRMQELADGPSSGK